MLFLLAFSSKDCCFSVMTDDSPSLKAAYALSSVDDNRRLYAAWSKDYDQEFAVDMDYILPQHVAQLFVEHGGNGPVLDVGAGTGLLGQVLYDHCRPIDALDLSQEMLDAAAQKSIYRHLDAADVTVPIKQLGRLYDGVVSSGTFTHGHVGSDAIDNLLPLAHDEALFCLSINKHHWAEKCFQTKFESLRPKIQNLTFVEVPIYGASATGPNRDDVAIIAIFRKREITPAS